MLKKSMRLLILLIAVLAIQNVRAEPIPPLPQQLKLIGQGLSARGTHRSLAVACYNADCTEVRFAYFPNQQEGKWIGAVIRHPSTELNLERLFVEEFIAKRTEKKVLLIDQQEWIAPGIVFIATPAAIIAGKQLGVNPYTGAALFLAPATGYLALELFTSELSKNLVSRSELNSFTTEKGTEGWNWASNPVKISKNRFEKLYEAVRADYRCVNAVGKYYRLLGRLNKELEERNLPLEPWEGWQNYRNSSNCNYIE